ncbi:polysaccharide deacetylase family protein [Kitasatospora brasiliensis]|uniref:polysaccharide deacetylase family protein n=1 Tax=Kitasatospora brasiliensis TaxID=3058040 RepID=UPI00292D5E78|nr:polysaccharide deacetylase family protein [Kitasatospora sp. K002]
MHRTARRPSTPTRPSRSRRRLFAGCVAVAAALGLAACGTANGALQSPSTAPVTSGTAAPTAAPSGTAATTIAPAPGSDAATPGSSPAASAPAKPHPSTATGSPVSAKPTAPATPAAPSSAAASPASSASPAAPPPHTGAGTVIGSTASGGRTVALTFDDGPGPATGQILDLLAQYHAKAVFCEIGQNAAANPALVKRILADGHRLCDHSVHHPQPFAKLSHDKAAYEITTARDMIVHAGGPGTEVGWFRAPGGGFNADNERITAGLGMSSLGWSVDPRDWSRPGVPAIVSTVQHQLKPGGVILMHDGGGDRGQTVAALKQLLPWLVEQGYTFDFPAA